MAKNKRAKLCDLREGRTVYMVHAFPHKNRQSSWLATYRLLGRVHGGTRFVPYTEFRFYKDERLQYDFSALDANVIPNHYNFHRLFTTKNAAQRYLDRMKSGSYTHAERLKIHERVQHNELLG